MQISVACDIYIWLSYTLIDYEYLPELKIS